MNVGVGERRAVNVAQSLLRIVSTFVAIYPQTMSEIIP